MSSDLNGTTKRKASNPVADPVVRTKRTRLPRQFIDLPEEVLARFVAVLLADDLAGSVLQLLLSCIKIYKLLYPMLFEHVRLAVVPGRDVPGDVLDLKVESLCSILYSVTKPLYVKTLTFVDPANLLQPPYPGVILSRLISPSTILTLTHVTVPYHLLTNTSFDFAHEHPTLATLTITDFHLDRTTSHLSIFPNRVLPVPTHVRPTPLRILGLEATLPLLADPARISVYHEFLRTLEAYGIVYDSMSFRCLAVAKQNNAMLAKARATGPLTGKLVQGLRTVRLEVNEKSATLGYHWLYALLPRQVGVTRFEVRVVGAGAGEGEAVADGGTSGTTTTGTTTSDSANKTADAADVIANGVGTISIASSSVSTAAAATATATASTPVNTRFTLSGQFCPPYWAPTPQHQIPRMQLKRLDATSSLWAGLPMLSLHAVYGPVPLTDEEESERGARLHRAEDQAIERALQETGEETERRDEQTDGEERKEAEATVWQLEELEIVFAPGTRVEPRDVLSLVREEWEWVKGVRRLVLSGGVWDDQTWITDAPDGMFLGLVELRYLSLDGLVSSM